MPLAHGLAGHTDRGNSLEQDARSETTIVCKKVVLDGTEESNAYSDGQVFEVKANSGFTIEVREGTCEYICSFIH